MLQLFSSGIVWHYSGAYKELFILCRNFIWFLSHLFSIKDLLKTLIYPWQRLGEQYRGGFHISEWFQSFILNTLMRIVGLVVRLFVILTGLLCILLAVMLSVLLFIIWTFIPLILVFLFITSIRLFLS